MKLFSAKNTTYIFHGLTIIYGLITAFYYVTNTQGGIQMGIDESWIVWYGHFALTFFILNIFLSVIYQFVSPRIVALNLLHILASIVFILYLLPISLSVNLEGYIGLFYLFATLCFLINVIYTLISYGIKSSK